MTREEFINWFEGFTLLTPNDIYELGQLYDEVTKPHWISVEDELPPMKGKSGQSDDVLVRLYNGRMDIDSYNFGYEEWEVDDKYITHWMPLPEAPKEGGEK